MEGGGRAFPVSLANVRVSTKWTVYIIPFHIEGLTCAHVAKAQLTEAQVTVT